VCRQAIPGAVDAYYPCGSAFQTFCIMIFSAEYVAKLVTCPFVRIELFDQELLLSQAIPSAEPRDFAECDTLGRLDRVLHFVFGPANLIDLISILPWWITEIAGTLLPASSTSFLRVVRIFRILRILKTGRYVQILQVLGSVIVNSGRSMVVLMLFISIVALVAGVLLSHVETSFDNIPVAVYWTFAQLISMKNTSVVGEHVDSVAGIIILAVVLALKGILWILPIGQIKSAFDQADKDSRETASLRDSMEYELTKPDWASWYGLSSSVRVHLEFFHVDASGSKIIGAHPVARASVPVPLLEAKRIKATLDVPVPNGMKTAWMEKLTGYVYVGFEFEWIPSDEMIRSPAPALPHGILATRVLAGRNFPGSVASRWCCRVHVPCGMAGSEVNTYDVVSWNGGPCPSFGQDTADFQVRWRADDDQTANTSYRSGALSSFFGGGCSSNRSLAATPLRSPATDREDEAEFRKSVLALLEAQSEQLAEQNRRMAVLEKKLATQR